MSWRVSLTVQAQNDLDRLEDFLVRAAEESGDYDLPLRAVAAIVAELDVLKRNPFTCRKTGDDPHERELVIPFGRSGYVALFHIVSNELIFVSALRHQREEDYH